MNIGDKVVITVVYAGDYRKITGEIVEIIPPRKVTDDEIFVVQVGKNKYKRRENKLKRIRKYERPTR